MAVYLVAYDLNKETTRPKITDYLYETYAYARLSESSYAIETAKSASAVFTGFGQFLDDNDQLYVIPLSGPYAGQGDEEINTWLDDNLPW